MRREIEGRDGTDLLRDDLAPWGIQVAQDGDAALHWISPRVIVLVSGAKHDPEEPVRLEGGG